MPFYLIQYLQILFHELLDLKKGQITAVGTQVTVSRVRCLPLKDEASAVGSDSLLKMP